MDNQKRQRLEAAGWQVGTVAEFLELSPSESEMIEVKLALSRKFKSLRESKKLSQQALAEKMQSSQSRVAKIEAGDSSATIDLMVQGLLSMGATRQEIAEAMLDS
ncbi:MAG: helix-turn-helix transcriptional regulator [Crocosphaera sp.]|nr:helix-turn-helix transcriptional regulator [Crocosphaera sp.]